MSHRKSRIIARLKRGPIGSTASVLRDVNKFRAGDDSFFFAVSTVKIDESRLFANVTLTCGHKAIVVSRDGSTLWEDSLPGSFDCPWCAQKKPFTKEPFNVLHDNIHQKEYPMPLHSLIANGGRIVIVGGRNKTWESYRKHPQLEFWSGDDPAETGRVIRNHGNSLPSNTKGLIISKFISHGQLDVVMRDARAKRIIMFPNKTDAEIFRLLDEILETENKPVTPEPVSKPVLVAPATPPVAKRQLAPKGAVKPVVQQHDVLSLAPLASAAAILEILKEKGITSTLGSVVQAIYTHRKELGVKSNRGKAPVTAPAMLMKADIAPPKPVVAPVATPKPPVVVPAPPTDATTNLLRIFDDAIAGLQLTREAVAATARRNQELEKLAEQMSKILKG